MAFTVIGKPVGKILQFIRIGTAAWVIGSSRLDFHTIKASAIRTKRIHTREPLGVIVKVGIVAGLQIVGVSAAIGISGALVGKRTTVGKV